MKILFCQPIFIPDENLKKKNFDSIKSLIYILQNKPENYEIEFKIQGWVKKDKDWEDLKDLIKSLNFRIEYERLDHNFGKSYVINKIIKETSFQDYIFTCDSDIVFLENQNYLKRLIECLEIYPEKERGLVAPYISDGTCHLYSHLYYQGKYQGEHGEETVVFNKDLPGGVAGGCFLIYGKTWEEIKGYKLVGTWGGEDGILMSEMFKKNFCTVVLKTVSIFHPLDIPGEKYRPWKNKRINNFKVTNSIEDLIKESEDSLKTIWKD